ncbi:MAG: hypothetical protein Kow0063_28450 [Anaerolineae bacterium]
MEPGGEVTYHLRLLNWTADVVPGGVISHTLPAGFRYVPGSTQVTVGGWPITQTDPISSGGTLVWGTFQLPAAGHTAHNPYGAHTFVQDLCWPEFIDFQLDQALELVGSGGYVTQLFYRITPSTGGPDPCAVYFVNAAYDRNLVPILRLQGVWNPAGFWEKPDPGSRGDYAEIAAAFARYVAGLPRRNTHPLYITIWNEPDLWVEWSGEPNAWEYGRFFVAVSNAIRRLNDPRIRILNGAVTPANTRFIRQLLQVPGFVSAFDAWASHCYPYNHPPWYNIHQRTARYGNAVIDCYIEERDAIARYGGRTGFKFVVKETGHGLGDDLYAFEGFPRINEVNRASYISSAFRDYWRNWPEVIAATPFELGDPWSGWEWLDWIDYTVSLDPLRFSYAPHRQYGAVAALDKPHGSPVPHGIEVSFRARVPDDLPPGVYISQLAGSAIGMATTLPEAAPVHVVWHVERSFLPILGANRNGGVWYMETPLAASPASQPPETSEIPLSDEPPPGGGADGAIIPTHFLTQVDSSLQIESQAAWEVHQVLDERPVTALTLATEGGHVYAGLAGGCLALLDLEKGEVVKEVSLGADLTALAPGPVAGMVYGLLDTGQAILVDMLSGEVIARAGDLSAPRGLVFDPLTDSLLVAETGTGAIIRLKGDLSGRAGVRALDDLPGQILLDATGRRLYVALPGARSVLELDADTWGTIAEARLTGGPLIEMALDAKGERLYVLSALSPRYRGITVLETDDLSALALVAGSPALPLKQTPAIALSSRGWLLAIEGPYLYHISPEDFSVVSLARPESGYGPGPVELAVDPATERIVWPGASGLFVTAEPSHPWPAAGP